MSKNYRCLSMLLLLLLAISLTATPLVHQNISEDDSLEPFSQPVNPQIKPTNKAGYKISDSPFIYLGFQYYQEINLYNPSSTALTDYPIRLVFTTQDIYYSLTSNKGTNIRFYTLEGGSLVELPYWIQAWNTSSVSVVWVKLNQIGAHTTKKIYLAYGPDTLSSASNGSAVFTFFDDFSESTLKSDWTFWNPGGDDEYSLTDRAGWLRIKVNGMSDTWSSSNYAPFVYITLAAGDYEIITKEDASHVGSNQHSLLAYIKSFSTGYGNKGYLGAYGSPTYVKFEADGYHGNSATVSSSTHYLRFRKLGTTIYYDVSVDGVTWTAVGSYNPSTSPLYWGLGGKSWASGNFYVDFDFFIVRTYMTNEPYVTSISTIKYTNTLNTMNTFMSVSSYGYVTKLIDTHSLLLSENYTKLWTRYITPNITGATIGHVNESNFEVLLFDSSNNGTLIGLNWTNGAILWTYNFPQKVFSIKGLAFEDLNHDGNSEILVGISWTEPNNSSILIFSYNGTLLRIYQPTSLSSGYGEYGVDDIQFIDIDSDGHKEAVILYGTASNGTVIPEIDVISLQNFTFNTILSISPSLPANFSRIDTFVLPDGSKAFILCDSQKSVAAVAENGSVLWTRNVHTNYYARIFSFPQYDDVLVLAESNSTKRITTLYLINKTTNEEIMDPFILPAIELYPTNLTMDSKYVVTLNVLYKTYLGQMNDSWNYATLDFVQRTTVAFKYAIYGENVDPYLYFYTSDIAIKIDSIFASLLSTKNMVINQLVIPIQIFMSNNTKIIDIENLPGWTHGGTYDNWAYGTPTAGPSTTIDGFCWGTNLAGYYANNEDSYLQSPVLHLASDAEMIILSFYTWYYTESCCDGGWVEISTDGTNWILLTPYMGIGYSGNNWWAGSSNGWVRVFFNLTQYSGNDVYIRFHFRSDGSVTNNGWYIDKIELKTIYSQIYYVSTLSVNAELYNITLLQDTDHDGLVNQLEEWINTDTTNTDSDGDGMPDGWEFEYGLGPLNNSDAMLDFDNDGLLNYNESVYHTNPWTNDTDGDGLTDLNETTIILDYRFTSLATTSNSYASIDTTYTTNITLPFVYLKIVATGWTDDYISSVRISVYLDGVWTTVVSDSGNLGTDYTTVVNNFVATSIRIIITEYDSAGSAGGGLENLNVTLGYSYVSSPIKMDTDADYLNDHDEQLYNASNLYTDCDNDGVLDGIEAYFGLNPVNSTDMAIDSDGDGYTNYYELKTLYTDPSRADTDGDNLTDYQETLIKQSSVYYASSGGTYTSITRTFTTTVDYPYVFLNISAIGWTDDYISHFRVRYQTLDSIWHTLVDLYDISTSYYLVQSIVPSITVEIYVEEYDANGDAGGGLEKLEVSLYKMNSNFSVFNTVPESPLLPDTDFDGLSDFSEASVTHIEKTICNAQTPTEDVTNITKAFVEFDNLNGHMITNFSVSAVNWNNDNISKLVIYYIDIFGNTIVVVNDTNTGLTNYTFASSLIMAIYLYVYVEENDTDGTQQQGAYLSVNVSIGWFSSATSRDSDSDTLSDYKEVVYYQTSPITNDTDNDMLPDNWEIKYNFNAISENNTYLDPEGDGVPNIIEYFYSSNPLSSDTDEDSLSDYDEIYTYYSYSNTTYTYYAPNGGYTTYLNISYVRGWTSPILGVNITAVNWNDAYIRRVTIKYYTINDTWITLVNTTFTQADNVVNYTYTNNSIVAFRLIVYVEEYDIDGNAGDGLEALYITLYNGKITNPNLPDTDFDGLIDSYEILHNLSPVLPDTDGDEMTDGWEVQYGLNPLNPSDALLDNDNDGLINREEFRWGASPLNNDTDGDGINDFVEVCIENVTVSQEVQYLKQLGSNDVSYEKYTYYAPSGGHYTHVDVYIDTNTSYTRIIYLSVQANDWSDDYISAFRVYYLDPSNVWHTLVDVSNVGSDYSFNASNLNAIRIHVYVEEYDSANSAGDGTEEVIISVIKLNSYYEKYLSQFTVNSVTYENYAPNGDDRTSLDLYFYANTSQYFIGGVIRAIDWSDDYISSFVVSYKDVNNHWHTLYSGASLGASYTYTIPSILATEIHVYVEEYDSAGNAGGGQELLVTELITLNFDPTIAVLSVDFQNQTYNKPRDVYTLTYRPISTGEYANVSLIFTANYSDPIVFLYVNASNWNNDYITHLRISYIPRGFYYWVDAVNLFNLSSNYYTMLYIPGGATDVTVYVEEYSPGGNAGSGNETVFVALVKSIIMNPASNDTDNDGMPDNWELLYGFNPIVDDASQDKDGDGLSNILEYIYHTNPDNTDTDNDGLSDYAEISMYFTNATNPDTDGDGMPDGWEVQYGLNATNPADASVDIDGDGLTNLQEYQHNADPTDLDTDDDGMPDGWEVQYGLNPARDDSSLDKDGDMLSNLGEYLHGTNATNPDTDSDGMSDGWEVTYNLDPLDASDASEDPDNDGLTNLQEYQYGTNPKSIDTDGDGMPDNWEIQNQLDPTSNDASADEDNDNLTNVMEYQHHTDPYNPDTDGDGMPDGWEVANGLNPTVNDASQDADGDGITNYEEYLRGTNPNSANSDGDLLPDNIDFLPGWLDDISIIGSVIAAIVISYVIYERRRAVAL